MSAGYRHEVSWFGREFVFLSSWDAATYEEKTKLAPLDRHTAAMRVRGWLEDRGNAAHDIRAAFRQSFVSRGDARSDDGIVNAFKYGHWKLYERPCRERRPIKVHDLAEGAPQAYVPPLPPALDPEPTAERTPPASKSHWLAIELVDDSGRPVGNVAYRVKTSDGRIVTGVLDRKGKARIEGLSSSDPCQVSFPELDSREWRAA